LFHRAAAGTTSLSAPGGKGLNNRKVNPDTIGLSKLQAAGIAVNTRSKTAEQRRVEPLRIVAAVLTNTGLRETGREARHQTSRHSIADISAVSGPRAVARC